MESRTNSFFSAHVNCDVKITDKPWNSKTVSPSSHKVKFIEMSSGTELFQNLKKKIKSIKAFIGFFISIKF